MTFTPTYSEGATPLDLNELDGLKHRHITTQGELNKLEQANIIAGLRWLERLRRPDVLSDAFALQLHKRLFGEVWDWGGKLRQTERNIGIDPLHIAVQLRACVDDARFWFRPLSTISANIFGWENEKLVGNAVLKFDSSHPAFQSLMDATYDDYLIPPWLPRTRRLYYSSLHMLGVPKHVSQLPYGTTGPDLLTWCIKSNRMQDQVQPREVFFPLPYERRFEAFRSGAACYTMRELPNSTVAIHLWFQGLVGGLRVSKQRRREVPFVESGSLLHEFAKELGMTNLIRYGG